jgi:hypothetical protein
VAGPRGRVEVQIGAQAIEGPAREHVRESFMHAGFGVVEQQADREGSEAQ